MMITTATGLVQLVERSTAEREVTGTIPGTKSILRVLEKLRRNRQDLRMARMTNGGPVPNWYFPA